MKFQRFQIWTALRVLVIVVNILAVAMYPQSQSNLDWRAAILIAIAFSICLFVWLIVVHARQPIDWSEPCSWAKPFFPMTKYPIRFWMLASQSFIAAGGTTIMLDVLLDHGHEAFGGTFLFWGFGIWITLKIWLKIHERQVTKASSKNESKG